MAKQTRLQPCYRLMLSPFFFGGGGGGVTFMQALYVNITEHVQPPPTPKATACPFTEVEA